MDLDSQSPKKEPSILPQGLSPSVDEELFTAYLEEQQSSLAEMESAILECEHAQDTEQIAALRRILHTMKGEAGMVGVNIISSFCHAAEEYLDGESVSVDVLLTIRDWLEKAVNAYMKREQPAPPPDISSLAHNENLNPQESRKEIVTVPGNEQPKGMPISDRDLAAEFVEESNEHFESADKNLLILEKDPANSEAVSAVFRAFHTIKGVAAFLELTPVNALAHEAETLLDEVRKGKRHFGGAVVEATFSSLDMLKAMMADLRGALNSGGEMPVRPGLDALMEVLRNLLSEQSGPSPAAAPSTKGAEPVAESATIPKDDANIIGAGTRAATEKESTASQTMKVDAWKLDQLLDVIGELVIAEAVVAGDPEILRLRSPNVEKNLAMLGKITRSLQDMGMTMRLVPVDPVFRKMARLVRDLSKKFNKRVELIIQGGDTEIDKSIVEKLGDPLVHMIRNSLDHGIESHDQRMTSGKPETATICLRAFHKGGNIHIEIEDDGKGLDREAIVNKAVEKGLIPSGDGISDQDVFALIFAPGFSTAKQVTETSGRGVGMDVVLRNIQSLRGNVKVRSTRGQGSLFTIVLPLTTAIIDGMLIRVGMEVYVLPTLSIVESFRPAPGDVHTITGKGEVVGFRGALVPLFRLHKLFDVMDGVRNPDEGIIIVVEEAGRQWGLLADELLGLQQVVIKPLGDAMGHNPAVAGASILSDGCPGLILDIAGIMRIASATESDFETRRKI